MSGDARPKVCAYARVSTGRQATNDLSIPDQIARAEKWCEANNAELVATRIDAGASATDDNRPEFQRMVEAATSDDKPYDIIVAYSLSRMFRNAVHFMQYRAALRRAQVRIVSITQEFGDDEASDLAMGMLALFDEYQSLETAKHTQRAMLKNAELGFWNGQTPPLGYRTYEAEKRGSKIKKKLEVFEDEAFVVRKIFSLYLDGPPGELPLGITRLAAWLNENGYKHRGKKFHVSNVQKILRNTAYIGVAFYNKRDSKLGVTRPEEEWIPIPVPTIVSEENFQTVQARLVQKQPAMTPARVTTTSNLLIGLAKCGCDGDGCGGGMTLSTGKGGRYRYYACSNRARAGETACKGNRISMPKLDEAVLDAIEARLLHPERLQALLAGWLDHSDQAISERRETLKSLRGRKTHLEAGLERLLDLVADGRFSSSDAIFAKKHGDLSSQLAQVKTDIVLLERQLASSDRRVTRERIEQFAELLRDKLRGDDPAMRQAYARMIVERVEVGSNIIRIKGGTNDIARGVGRVGTMQKGTVPTFERKWRTRQDSNL
ncbi:recombinase family protein [Sphingomicrobium sp. XHP0235]|uniref:recombinase family protein n=1 Tax=Sphingomicrobium aquimarinum TaxID=3133971 RepID=UPI0031FE6B4B